MVTDEQGEEGQRNDGWIDCVRNDRKQKGVFNSVTVYREERKEKMYYADPEDLVPSRAP